MKLTNRQVKLISDHIEYSKYEYPTNELNWRMHSCLMIDYTRAGKLYEDILVGSEHKLTIQEARKFVKGNSEMPYRRAREKALPAGIKYTRREILDWMQKHLNWMKKIWVIDCDTHERIELK